MNEEGAVELAPGAFSIEPMVAIDGRLFTWADVVQRQELLEGVLPVPSAIWETAAWRLRVQGEATESGLVRLRYRLENRSDRSLSARLLVLVRPFQVTPPWQSVGRIGGVSLVHDLAWEAGALRVNETAAIVPASAPSGFAATRFDEGFVALRLATAGREPADTRVHDALGLASGALAFDLALEPRATAERIVECPPAHSSLAIGEPAFDWAKELPAAQWSGSGWAMDAIRAALTATAHILVTRSGAALQPGPRRYARSWIRDGSIMSAALLRMGHREEVLEFIRWYAPYQRADGFVPCCVDRNGPDWLVEHDSHGQLIAAIADCYRFTADARFLEESWPFVVKAVGCIEGLLEEDGLLPVSVSHEGYLAQPVHSYWDDFWALRGLRDAVDLAHKIEDRDAAARWSGLAERFASALFGSIERTRAAHKLDFIPGSVEWADFDPTATANAIALPRRCRGPRPQSGRTYIRHDTFPTGVASAAELSNGRITHRTRSASSVLSCGSGGAKRRSSCCGSSCRTGGRPRGISGRRSRGGIVARRRTWGICRTPGWPQSTCSRSAACSPTSGRQIERSWWRRALRRSGRAAPGVQVQEMPTLYGALSFSARTLDEHTLRFDIGPGVAAGIELRPPLVGAPARRKRQRQRSSRISMRSPSIIARHAGRDRLPDHRIGLDRNRRMGTSGSVLVRGGKATDRSCTFCRVKSIMIAATARKSR